MAPVHDAGVGGVKSVAQILESPRSFRAATLPPYSPRYLPRQGVSEATLVVARARRDARHGPGPTRVSSSRPSMKGRRGRLGESQSPVAGAESCGRGTNREVVGRWKKKGRDDTRDLRASVGENGEF
jgi:hypothetical protein